MASFAERLDRFQRKHRVIGFPLAVTYKFFDDQGSLLAAMSTFYAFVAIFPLLLLASSIFGFVLQDRPDLQEDALNSALAQFPIIGDQLGRPEGLTGSVTAVVVGLLAAGHRALAAGVGTGALACAVLQLRIERRLHEQQRAVDERAERVLALIWEDWVQVEVARGHLARGRWRRKRPWRGRR